MMRGSERQRVFVFAVLVGISLLCSGCGGGSEVVVTATEVAATATPRAAPTPTETAVVATDTPRPTATATATATPEPAVVEECTWSAAYVADVTIPDGTRLDPGAAFVKTWRVRNTGTCDWEGVRLAFAGGEQMGAADWVAVPATAAGEEVDVSVEMVAPESPGSYGATWGICAEACFYQVTVEIVSGEPEAAVPTSAPEATAAPTVAVQPTVPSSPGYPPGVWLCPVSTEGAAYVGSTTSDKFHCLSCRYAGQIAAENRLCFASREAAVGYGYQPCGVCNP